MQQDIRQVIRELESLSQNPSGEPLLRVLRPWLIITGLDFHHTLHLSWEILLGSLLKVHAKLGPLIGILHEDQAQEAACREIGDIKVYTEITSPDEPSTGILIHWDGTKWLYTTDPKLRLHESSPRFVDARDAVLKLLETAAA